MDSRIREVLEREDLTVEQRREIAGTLSVLGQDEIKFERALFRRLISPGRGVES